LFRRRNLPGIAGGPSRAKRPDPTTDAGGLLQPPYDAHLELAGKVRGRSGAHDNGGGAGWPSGHCSPGSRLAPDFRFGAGSGSRSRSQPLGDARDVPAGLQCRLRPAARTVAPVTIHRRSTAFAMTILRERVALESTRLIELRYPLSIGFNL